MEIPKFWYKLSTLLLLQALPGVVSTATSIRGAGTASSLEHRSPWWRAEATVLKKLWLNEMLENSLHASSGWCHTDAARNSHPAFWPLISTKHIGGTYTPLKTIIVLSRGSLDWNGIETKLLNVLQRQEEIGIGSKNSVKHQHLSVVFKKYRFWGKAMS